MTLKIVLCLMLVLSLPVAVLGDEYSADYWINESINHYQKGSYDLALRCIEKALDQQLAEKEDEVLALTLKCKILSSLYKYEDALLCVDNAIEIDPSNPLPLTYKASTLCEYASKDIDESKYDEGFAKLDESIKYCDKVIEINPLYYHAWNTKGMVYAWLWGLCGAGNQNEITSYFGDTSNYYFVSIKCFDNAISISPEDEFAWYGKSNCMVLNYLLLFARSIETYEKANSAEQNDSIDSYMECLDNIEKIIELDQQYDEFWSYGISIFGESHIEQMNIKSYDYISDLEYTMQLKGLVLQALHRDEEARIAFDKSTELSAMSSDDKSSVAKSEMQQSVKHETPPGSREKPVQIGEYCVNLGDGWEITVLDVIPDATQIVLNENPFNDPPKDGHQFFLAKISACYNGEGSDNFDADLRMRAVGRSNVAYSTFENSCGVIPDSFPSFTEVFDGGCIDGYIGWEVKSSDFNSLVMYDCPLFNEKSNRVYLSLVP